MRMQSLPLTETSCTSNPSLSSAVSLGPCGGYKNQWLTSGQAEEVGTPTTTTLLGFRSASRLPPWPSMRLPTTAGGAVKGAEAAGAPPNPPSMLARSLPFVGMLTELSRPDPKPPRSKPHLPNGKWKHGYSFGLNWYLGHSFALPAAGGKNL